MDDVDDVGTTSTGDMRPAAAAGMRIVVSKDGPYLVSGGVPLAKQFIEVNEKGESCAWRRGETYPHQERYALCRCGHSKSKPFCDGAHVAVGFDGTETASHSLYLEQAVCVESAPVKLLDARALCAEARFCDRAGGLWNLVKDCEDPETRALVEEEAALCPAGRYVACDPATDAQHEPPLEPSIGLIEDPHLGVSGPLWVRGGIPIVSADGTGYEVRNRVTLCRCGQSENKPLCDGSHIKAGFRDDE